LPPIDIADALKRLSDLKGPEAEARVRRILKLQAEKNRQMDNNPIAWHKPLGEQQRFHESSALHRLLTGGNRSGKTKSGAAELIFWLRGDSPYREIPKGPLTGVVSGLTFDLAENSLKADIEALMPRDGSFTLTWNRENKLITGPNGRAIFKSNEQGWKSYQAIALDFFWLDEEHDIEIYRQLRKRLKKDSVLHAWYTMTAEPDRPDHWTYDLLAVPAAEGQEGYAHFKLSLEDNRQSRGGHIPDEMVDELIATTPLEERPAVIYGQYVRRGGLMYPMWKREHHVVPEKPLDHWLNGCREGVYTPFCWLDWGVRNPTAIGLVMEDKDGKCVLIDEIYRPAVDIVDIRKEYQKRFAVFRPTFVVADPSIWYNHESTDPSKTIAGQLERDDVQNKLSAWPLLKANNDHESGFSAVRTMLRVDPQKGPTFQVQDNCRFFIREIEAYVGDEWVTHPDRKNKKEVAVKKNDHHMDGFRYFCMSPHNWIPGRWVRRRNPVVRINPVTGYMRAGV
jgi:phage terminase large subunit-like protein